MPAGHSTQVEAWALLVNEPAGQAVQADEPGAEKLPALQTEHEVDDRACEYSPAGHRTHAVAFGVAEKAPAAHGQQPLELPVEGLDGTPAKPAAQMLHTAEPTCAVVVPERQGVQLVAPPVAE